MRSPSKPGSQSSRARLPVTAPAGCARPSSAAAPSSASISRSVEMCVEHSRAQLILLIGEAGVGKSRLAEEAASLAEATHEAAVLEGRCVPYGEANIWWPIGEMLRDGTGIHPDDSPEVARRRCLGAVAAVLEQPATSDAVARVAEGLLFFMGFPTALDSLDPARAREDAALSLFSFTEAYLRVRPVVVVLSDLHWADDLVLDLLDRMLRALGSLPFVVVATARRRPGLPLAAAGASQHGRHQPRPARPSRSPRSCSTRSPSRACRAGSPTSCSTGAAATRSSSRSWRRSCATRPRPTTICPISPTTSAASSPLASTRCHPASAPRSKTQPCSGGRDP